MNSKTTFRSNSAFFKFKNTKKIKHYPFLVLFLFSIFSYGQTTWTGATSTDWFNAGNWSDDIPDANDDVTIGNTANSPIIGTLGALANSISLIEGAILNVDVDGELTVELLDNTMVTDAVTLFGTINNTGIIRIGTATSGGATGLFLGELTPIENPGIFNNFSGSQSDKIIISGLLISETTAQLYDITCRLIKSKDLDAANTYNTLGTNGLSAGTYIIKLISKLNGNRTQKIILD